MEPPSFPVTRPLVQLSSGIKSGARRDDGPGAPKPTRLISPAVRHQPADPLTFAEANR